MGLVLGASVSVVGCSQPPAPAGFLVGPEPDSVGEFGEVEFDGGLVFEVRGRSCVMVLEGGGTAQVFLGVDDVSNTSLELVVRSGLTEGTTVSVQNPGQNVPFLSGPFAASAPVEGELAGEVVFEQDSTGAQLELDVAGSQDC